jgi:hypothetical protein
VESRFIESEARQLRRERDEALVSQSGMLQKSKVLAKSQPPLHVGSRTTGGMSSGLAQRVSKDLPTTNV